MCGSDVCFLSSYFDDLFCTGSTSSTGIVSLKPSSSFSREIPDHFSLQFCSKIFGKLISVNS